MTLHFGIVLKIQTNMNLKTSKREVRYRKNFENYPSLDGREKAGDHD
jgi:hypothetical protein